jgi:DNA-binding IclR family transcriptional regulator
MGEMMPEQPGKDGLMTRMVVPPPAAQSPVRKRHRTVDRITAILEITAQSRDTGIGLAELARRLDAPKSSNQGFVHGLVAVGYLAEQGGRYLLGPGTYVATMAAGRPAWIVPHEAVVALAERTGATALVAVRCGDDAVYVDIHGTSSLLSFYATSRLRRPLLTTAVGKAMLAMMGDADLDRYLLHHTGSEQAAVDRFLSGLPEIRRTGYAVNRQESLAGMDAVATAIPDPAAATPAVAGLAWTVGSIGTTAAELGELLVRQVQSWAGAHGE